MVTTLLQIIAQIGSSCRPAADITNRFLGFPYWYEYLPGERDTFGKCIPTFDWSSPGGSPAILWGIALAISEILLRVVAIVAVGYIIYGGFQYMTSAGEPDRTKSAKDTILNGLIGSAIAIFAVAIVSFIGNRLG